MTFSCIMIGNNSFAAKLRAWENKFNPPIDPRFSHGFAANDDGHLYLFSGWGFSGYLIMSKLDRFLGTDCY